MTPMQTIHRETARRAYISLPTPLVKPSLGDESPKCYSDPEPRTCVLVGIYVVGAIMLGVVMMLVAVLMTRGS